MPYGDFDLSTARDRFNLRLVENLDLFTDAPAVVPGDVLWQQLEELTPLALAINTEKARSELIIAPILVEVIRRSGGRVSLFSGVAFDVDRESGLNGTCDYILSRSPEQYFVSRPVAVITEAKRENIIGGLGQCAAAMVAAQLFNSRHDQPVTEIRGAVTTGSLWRFLRLDGNRLAIDRREYYQSQIDKILGILLTAANGFAAVDGGVVHAS